LYSLQGEDLQAQIGALGSGSTVEHIKLEDIPSLLISLPPLPIQRRIAGILSAYDDLIENCQKRIKILETMARSLYREWFVAFRFPGHEKVKLVKSKLGMIPEGWEINPLHYFGAIITGKTPNTANRSFFGTDIQFLKTPDMHGNIFIIDTNEYLSTTGAESQAKKMLPAGSICVSCIGTIGVVSITTEECQTNQQINSIVLSSGASREYLFFCLQNLKQALENLGANGATMGNVNKGKFEAIEVIAPTMALLDRFNNISKTFFYEMLALYRKISTLRRTRDLLLPRLMSGKIDIS
jgi:type I restriction enzyme S subunit